MLSSMKKQKIEYLKNSIKENQNNYGESLKQYYNETLNKSEKDEDSFENMDAQKIIEIEKSFQLLFRKNQSDILYQEFPFIDKLATVVGESYGLNENKKGCFNHIYDKLSLLNKFKTSMLEMLETFEIIFSLKLSDDKKSICSSHFSNLESALKNFYDATEDWYVRSGKSINSNYKIPDEITSLSLETLNETIKRYFIGLDKTMDDALTVFAEVSKELIITNIFAIFTGFLYLGFHRDIYIHGANWAIAQSDVDRSKSNVLQYVDKLIGLSIKNGWELSKLNNSSNYTYPPYFDAIRKISNADLMLYPHCAIDTEKISEVYQVEGKKGSYKLPLLYLPGIGFGKIDYSLRSGYFGLSATIPPLPFLIKVEFPKAIERRFQVKFHHHIEREARWTLTSGSVTKNFVFSKSESPIESFLVNYEENSPKDYEFNQDVVTIDQKTFTLTCHRSELPGLKSGYAVGSVLYMIELIFE
ncbi:hypothetical protein ACTA71_010561 [Dictyostelium dimigraforme]